jgi:hypothetical protein
VKHLLVGLTLAVGFVMLGANPASAGECNLYDTSTVCSFSYDGGQNALFQVVNPHPTGTGFIDSFLRVQMKGYEEGFNTSARPALCDNVDCDIKTDPNYTRNLLVGDVPIVNINGIDYRQFFLDINEPDADKKAYITLDQIEIYVGDANLSSYDSTGLSGTGSLTGGTKIFDLDNALTYPKDNWINLNYGLMGGGSGTGDMVMYIPNSYFAGVSSSSYVYLYSQFGCITSKDATNTCGKNQDGSIKYGYHYPSNAGFEEWWTYNYSGGGGGGTTPMPEPTSFALLATGLAYAARNRVRKHRAKSE